MRSVFSKIGEAFMEFLHPNLSNVPNTFHFGHYRTPSPAYFTCSFSHLLSDQPKPRRPRTGPNKLADSYYYTRDTRRAPLPRYEETAKTALSKYKQNTIEHFPQLKSIPALEYNFRRTDFSFRSQVKNDSISIDDLHLPPTPSFKAFLSEATGYTDFDNELAAARLPTQQLNLYESVGIPNPTNEQTLPPQDGLRFAPVAHTSVRIDGPLPVSSVEASHGKTISS